MYQIIGTQLLQKKLKEETDVKIKFQHLPLRKRKMQLLFQCQLVPSDTVHLTELMEQFRATIWTGDTVKYGPIEPQFKDFVKKMNEWYQKGLLESDMASYDAKALIPKF